MRSVRAFLGIPLPATLRETLAACRTGFQSAEPDWRQEKWVADENLHLTLRFLGQVQAGELDPIVAAVSFAAARAPAFRLRLARATAVPRRRGATLLWVCPDAGADETRVLAECLGTPLAALGYPAETRRFEAHVTMCRARRPRPVSAAGIDEIERVLHRSDDRGVAMSVRGFTLYRSTLTPLGIVYEEIASVPLGG